MRCQQAIQALRQVHGIGVAQQPETLEGSELAAGRHRSDPPPAPTALAVRAPTRPNTRIRQAKRLLSSLTLLGTMALTGCRSPGRLPLELYLAIGTNPEQSISAELRDEFRERVRPLQQSFRRLHTDTQFQLSLYPEAGIAETLRQSNATGLAPDLIYVNGDTALRLLNAGLVDPFPLSREQRRLFNPNDLSRLELPDGRLAGLPLLIFPQLSCYNRKRMATPPATVRELLQASAAGQPIGLNADMGYLLWSVGSLGALPALERMVHRQPPTPADRQAIQGWLAWLQEAGTQQRVSFYPDQKTAETELADGLVTWIPCRSTALSSLRKRMGRALAIAPLPNGDGHQASPVNRLRVVALGRHSSARGRLRALEFAQYMASPLAQRSLTLGAQDMLPANRFVSVPVQSSQTLATMVEAVRQGQLANPLVTLVHTNDPRLSALQTLITELAFGTISAPEATPRVIRILQGAS